MTNKKRLIFFLIFVLLCNCSFDKKTGIWDGDKKEKKRISELEQKQKNIIDTYKIYSSEDIYSKEISLKISKNGYLILSGILAKQANKILSAYNNYKLILEKKITIDGWTTIIMKRNG